MIYYRYRIESELGESRHRKFYTMLRAKYRLIKRKIAFKVWECIEGVEFPYIEWCWNEERQEPEIKLYPDWYEQYVNGLSEDERALLEIAARQMKAEMDRLRGKTIEEVIIEGETPFDRGYVKNEKGEWTRLPSSGIFWAAVAHRWREIEDDDSTTLGRILLGE